MVATHSKAVLVSLVISCTSYIAAEEGGLRQRFLHGLESGMEASPSLTITGSRRARSGNSRTTQGVDSVGGDVVDLTTDSGVEDDEVVDITDQVSVPFLLLITV